MQRTYNKLITYKLHINPSFLFIIIQFLINGQDKVIHFVDTSQRGGVAFGQVESLPENEKKLRELEEECLEELKQVVLAAGQDYNPDGKINNVNEVIQIEALRII